MPRALSLIITALIGLSITAVPANASKEREVTTASQDRVIEWSTQQLDGYYKTLFALTGQEYRTPRVTILELGDTVYTGCGPATGEGLAFYCPASEEIVIGRDIVDMTSNRDDFVPAYVLSHEWAHHAQLLSGSRVPYLPYDGDWNQVYTLENELRADCMSGTWMASLSNRELLDDSDFPAVLAMAGDIGDDAPYGRVNSHGTDAERLQAIFVGYEDGLIACTTITPFPRGEIEDVPYYTGSNSRADRFTAE